MYPTLWTPALDHHHLCTSIARAFVVWSRHRFATFAVPNVKAVVYVTRSVQDVENHVAVNAAIKWHRESGEGTRPFRVCPPTLPLTSNDIRESEKDATRARGHRPGNAAKDNFLRMKQSPDMNGCFVAVLSREVGRWRDGDATAGAYFIEENVFWVKLACVENYVRTNQSRDELEGVENVAILRKSNEKLAFCIVAKNPFGLKTPKHLNCCAKFQPGHEMFFYGLRRNSTYVVCMLVWTSSSVYILRWKASYFLSCLLTLFISRYSSIITIRTLSRTCWRGRRFKAWLLRKHRKKLKPRKQPSECRPDTVVCYEKKKKIVQAYL